MGGTSTTIEPAPEAAIKEQVKSCPKNARRDGQPEGEGQRKEQGCWKRKCERRRWCSGICATIALCQLPGPSVDFSLDSRHWSRSRSPIDFEFGVCSNNDIYQQQLRQQRVDLGFAPGLPGQRTDAPRCSRTVGQDKPTECSVLDKGPPYGNKQSWQGQEDVAGNSGGQKGPQTSLGKTSRGLDRAVGQAAAGVHSAASHIGREGEQGHQGHPGGEQSNSKSEFASCGRQRMPNPGSPSRAFAGQPRALHHKRQGHLGQAEEVAEDPTGMCSLSRTEALEGHSGDRGLGRRGRNKEKETKISRSSQWCSHWCRYFVICGRASTRHALSGEHRRPCKLRFDPLVEAYDFPSYKAGRAACPSFDIAITFHTGDFLWPPGEFSDDQWPHHDADNLAATLRAQQTANCLRHQVICDSIRPPFSTHRLCERPQVADRLHDDPFTFETPDQFQENGPLIIIDEWNELIELLTDSLEDDDEEFALIMYGLLNVHHSTRSAITGPTIDEIRDTILRTWSDVIPPGGVTFVHLVKPQLGAFDVTHSLQVIIEILPLGFEVPPNDFPVLRRVHWHADASVETVAAYLTDQSTGFEIFRDSDLQVWCHPWRGTQCNLHIENHVALLPRRHTLRRGSLIDIFIHNYDDDNYAADTDTVGLMQRPKPSRSPDLLPVRFLGLQHVTALVHVNQDEPLTQQLRSRWPLRQRSADDLEAVHYVAFPPQYVSAPPEHLYLMQFRDDRFSQIHVDDVLILLTISFTSPSNTNTQKVRVLWGPRRTTRDQLLGFLRVRWFCDQPTTLCFTYLNNHNWMDRDTTTRRLEFGDHVRIQIRSDKVQWTDFEFSEEVECGMRIFSDSPEPEVQPGSESESLSQYTIRSRSRERRRDSATGNGTADEEEDAGEGEESGADSHSLLQTGFRMRSTMHEPLRPSVDPHVSDRWCVKQLGASSCNVPESCADQPQVEGGSAPETPFSRPTPLITLDNSIGALAPWKRWIAERNFGSSSVRGLGDFILNLQPWPDTAFSTTWSSIPERHETVDLIDMLQPVPGPVGDFHIFLDGSYFPSTGLGAWAFSVVLRDARSNFYRWSFTGNLVEHGHGALRAEAEAFAYALDWMISSLSDTTRPIFIYGDATAIGFGADGTQNIATGLDDLGRLVRNLFCLAQSALPQVSYRHVKAHSGQIDNELVDSTAKAIAKQQWSPHVGIPNRSRWQEAPMLHWAWLLAENARSSPSSLPLLDDLATGLSLPSVPQTHTDLFGLRPEVKPGSPSLAASIKIGTANVRSLKEGACYNGFYDKRELIMAQFVSHGYDIMALQETRAKTDRIVSFNGITRLVASANHGQGGVELWINHNGPISEAGCGPLNEQHFYVRHSASTWLIADCDHPLLQCTFAVAYAPQAGRQQSDIDQWWEEFSNLLLPLKNKEIVLLGDFNAHLGSVETSGIGPHAWEEENRAGGLLRSLL